MDARASKRTENFNKGAPLYERKRLFNRFIKMAVAAKEKKIVDTKQKEEEKKKNQEAAEFRKMAVAAKEIKTVDTKQKEEEKKKNQEAAELKSKEILLKEKSKEIKVIELEGEDSEDLNPSSNQKATNIKLNLSEKDKDKSNSTKFVFIGKAPNYKKSQPQKPASQKSTPWYKREDILNKKESDTGTSSNITNAVKKVTNVSEKVTNASEKVTNASEKVTNASEKGTNAVEKVTKKSQSPDVGTFKSTFKNVQAPTPNSIKKPEETSSSKSSLYHKDKISVVEKEDPDVKQIKKKQSDSFAHNVKLSEITLPETSSTPSSSNANVPQPMDIDNSQDVKSKPKSEEEKDFLLLSINKEDFQPLVVPVPPPTSMVSYPVVPSVQTVSSNVKCITSSASNIQNIKNLDFSVPPPTISVPPPTISVPPPTISPYQNNSQHMSIYGNQNNAQNMASYSYPTNNPQMPAYSNSPQMSLQSNYQNMLPYSTPPPVYRNPPPVLPYSNTGNMPPAPQYSYTNNMPYNTYSNSMPANQSYEPSMYPLPSNNQTQYPIPNASQNLVPPGSESIRNNNTKFNVVATNVSTHVPQSKTSPTLQKAGNLIRIVPENINIKVSESGKDNKPIKLEKTTPKINVQDKSKKVTAGIPAGNNVAKDIKNVVKHETEKTSNAVKFDAGTLKTSKIVSNIEKSSNANSDGNEKYPNDNSNGKEKTVESINSLLKQSVDSQIKYTVNECIEKIELKEHGNRHNEEVKSSLTIDMPVVLNNSVSINNELIKFEQMTVNEASDIKSEQMIVNEASDIKSENKIDENVSGEIFMKTSENQVSAKNIEVDVAVLINSPDNVSSLVENSNKDDETGGDKENKEVNVTTKAAEKVIKDDIHVTNTILEENIENAASDSMFSTSEVAEEVKENKATAIDKADEKIIQDNAHDSETILKENTKKLTEDSVSHDEVTGNSDKAENNIIENSVLDIQSVLKEDTQNIINSASESSYDKTSKANPEKGFGKLIVTDNVSEKSVESGLLAKNLIDETSDDVEMTNISDSCSNKNVKNEKASEIIPKKIETDMNDLKFELLSMIQSEEVDDGTSLEKSSDNIYSSGSSLDKIDKLPKNRENMEVTLTVSENKIIEDNVFDEGVQQEQNAENVKNDSVLDSSFYEIFKVNHEKVCDNLVEENENITLEKSTEYSFLAEDSSNNITEKSEDQEMTDISTVVENENITDSSGDKKTQNEDTESKVTFSVGADEDYASEKNKTLPNTENLPMSIDGIVDSKEKDSNVTDVSVNILSFDKNEISKVSNLKCEEEISDQDLKDDSDSELMSPNVKKQRKRKGRKTCSKKVLKTNDSSINNEENVKDEPCINTVSERQTRSKRSLKTEVTLTTNEETVKDEPCINILSTRQTRSKKVLKTDVSSTTDEENAKDESNLKYGESISCDSKDDNNSQLTSSNVKKPRGRKGRKTRGKKVLKTPVTKDEPSLCTNPGAFEENNQTSSGEEDKFESISSQGGNLEDCGIPILEKVTQDIKKSEDKVQDTHLKLDKKNEDSRISEDEAKASSASGSQDSEKCDSKDKTSAKSATEEKEKSGRRLRSSKSPKKSSSDLKNISASDTEEYEDDDDEEKEAEKMDTE